MASLSNDKRPQQQPRSVYANWFFSLGRIKQKKTASRPTASLTTTVEGQPPAPIQRSCIDLRTTNSVFYLDHTKDVEGGELGGVGGNGGTASTDNIYEDESHLRKRAGTMSKLCSPCCGVNKTNGTMDIDKKTVTPLRRYTPTKYETLQESTDLLNFSNNCISTTPSTPTTPDRVVTLVSKRADFLRTTTVTTTRTLTITRPIEIMLNEKGEIVSKRHSPQELNARNCLQQRSNSLDCILDERASLNELNLIVTTPVGGVRPGILASCDDLQYIDENCNSNNNNNNNLHAYSEKCQIVNEVEQPNEGFNGRQQFDATKTTTTAAILNENQHKNNMSNNVIETDVIMLNNRKVRE